ncbi:diguanylate cyclase [Psychromonas sp. PT13]|uniref:diguanylate cyclase n=1 Tax=Psychromonas sp. PT13 TaxID=3439547 RepID=UPI003EBAB941
MEQKSDKYILVVEDSQMFSRILKRSIESVEHFKVVIAESFAELKAILSENKYQFFAGLLDVNLPDAPNGEVIDYVLEHDITSVVFTGKLDENFRKKIYKRGIVDYVLKEGPSNVEYMVSLLKQLDRNQNLNVLVVDDSSSARSYIKHLLLIYQFNVYEASDGIEALSVLEANNIHLVLTDFYMPNMDGLELTKKIRTTYSSQEVAIIGMSVFGNNKLSAHFLKLGGSDFITKPFLEEEFFCRINQNMELLEHIRELKYLATKDHLTGLYNRRYLFEQGKALIDASHEKETSVAVALLDVDFFKHVNDEHGHDIGDKVLFKLGSILLNQFHAPHIVSRYGGEEFCLVLSDITEQESFDLLDGLRELIAEHCFTLDNGDILQMTVSIGVHTSRIDNLKDALKRADQGLYQAKHEGRNQVVLIK